VKTWDLTSGWCRQRYQWNILWDSLDFLVPRCSILRAIFPRTCISIKLYLLISIFICFAVTFNWVVRWDSPLGNPATIGPVAPAPDDRWVWSRGNRITRRELSPLSFCSPEIRRDLTTGQTRSAAMGSRRLSARAMALSGVCSNFLYERCKQVVDLMIDGEETASSVVLMLLV
jgi:hypothetical protein